MRTSASHPLQIASVSLGPKFGRIGLTLCPGKYDPYGLTGGWNRDLACDLDAIRDWGAIAVVTLVTSDELASLRVDRLGAEVVCRNMRWFHIPIVDASVPDERFERRWISVDKELHSSLARGLNVLLHCRGGLGRAGTIAARLLVESGMEPKKAIVSVRAVRPGAIETPEQEEYILSIQAKRKQP